MPIHGLLISAFQQRLAELVGYDEFLPASKSKTELLKIFCEPEDVTAGICDEILFAMFGDPRLNQVPMDIALISLMVLDFNWLKLKHLGIKTLLGLTRFENRNTDREECLTLCEFNA